jgi:hypothetical protein
MENHNSTVNNLNNTNNQNILFTSQNESINEYKNYIFVLEQNLKNQVMENNNLKNEIISLHNELQKKIL